MDDRSFKDKLSAAMEEPSAPAALVRRTVVRIEAIRSGMSAEETLSREGEKLSADERRKLAAQSVVGRLMQNLAPPDGVSVDMMTGQLMEKPTLQRLAAIPPDRLVDDLRHGRVNKMLALSADTPQKDSHIAKAEAGLQRNGGPKL